MQVIHIFTLLLSFSHFALGLSAPSQAESQTLAPQNDTLVSKKGGGGRGGARPKSGGGAAALSDSWTVTPKNSIWVTGVTVGAVFLGGFGV